MSMMRVAGKGADDNAYGIRTDNNGFLIIKKQWAPTVELNAATASFDEGDTDPVALLGIAEIGKYGLSSLRIANSTGVSVTISLYADRSDNDVSWLYDLEGNLISIIIPAESHLYVVTPDDWPILNYVDWLNLRITPNSAVVSSDNPRVRVSVVGRS